MAKKGSRLREFEKNNRVLDITGAQQARKKKRAAEKQRRIEKKEPETAVKAVGETKAKPQKKKRNWVRIVSMAVVAVFLVVVGMSVKNIFFLQGEARTLTDKQAELKKQRDDLTVELENVSSDEYIEEQARKALKLVKGNELIFYFPEDMTIAAQKEAEAANNSEDDGE